MKLPISLISVILILLPLFLAMNISYTENANEFLLQLYLFDGDYVLPEYALQDTNNNLFSVEAHLFGLYFTGYDLYSISCPDAGGAIECNLIDNCYYNGNECLILDASLTCEAYLTEEVCTNIVFTSEAGPCIWHNNSCKKDSDIDNIPDKIDNCPNINNPEQEDTDEDNVGDKCDNCKYAHNPWQEDLDNNGVADACETISCTEKGDTGIDYSTLGKMFGARKIGKDFHEFYYEDLCHPNPVDYPNTLYERYCDKNTAKVIVYECPFGCQNGVCASAEADTDGDGVPDSVDNCDTIPNPNQINNDNDGFGAACECDDTNPGINPSQPEICGDLIDQDCNGVDPSCIYCIEEGDTGIDYYTFGRVYGTRKIGDDYFDFDYSDLCHPTYPNKLYERYCDGDDVRVVTYACPNGCENGVCK